MVSIRNENMSHNIWLRLNLPGNDVAALQQDFSNCVFHRSDDAGVDVQQLREVDVVFTEETLPDRLVQQMSNLKWLHVTAGVRYALTPPRVKARPIQVTGSKGIHGTVFSEFALACILALAKKLPECWAAQKERKWQKLATEEIAGK